MPKTLQPKHVIIGLLFLGMMSCSGPPPADSFFDRTQAEAEIREIENAWAQVAVSGDPAVIGRIFADEARVHRRHDGASIGIHLHRTRGGEGAIRRKRGSRAGT